MTKQTETPATIWGQHIQELRVRSYWTRQDVEDRLDGITGDTINPIERGDVRRTRDNKQQKLAGLFGVSLGYLQTGQPHHPEGPDEDILNYPVGGLSLYRVALPSYHPLLPYSWIWRAPGRRDPNPRLYAGRPSPGKSLPHSLGRDCRGICYAAASASGVLFRPAGR